MEELNFIVKGKSYSKADVSISLVGKTKKQVSITFRNNADKKITNSGYITMAVLGERMYFKEANDVLGYYLSDSGKSNKFVCIRNKSVEDFAATHSGDYWLQYDKDRRLYFVDTE